MTSSEPVPERPLLDEANSLICNGDWRAAAQLLAQAATTAEREDRHADAARCQQMAATLFRYAGDISSSQQRLNELCRLQTDTAKMEFVAEVELGENRMFSGDYDAAISAYSQAIKCSEHLGFPSLWRAVVMRRLGEALARAGNAEEAFKIYKSASYLHASCGDVEGAARINVECAESLASNRATNLWLIAIQRAEFVVEACDNIELSSRVALLRAKMLCAQGAYQTAITAAKKSQESALKAVEPVVYLAASSLLSGLHDSLGERTAAYRVLATAWVTLSDLLGREIGSTWIRPLLIAFRSKWGEHEFSKAKQTYESCRLD